MKTLIGCAVSLIVLLPGAVFGQGMDELIAKLDAISNDCPNAWVNEFHYDDQGIDTNEFIEICFGPDSGPTNLNEYQCWIYDQYGGAISNIGLEEFNCPGGMTREEIEGVNFQYADLADMTATYNPETLKDGFNTMPDGEEIFYISNPGLGLWSFRDRFR